MSVIKNDDDFLFSVGIKDNNTTCNPAHSRSNFKELKKEKEFCKKDISFIIKNIRKYVRVKHTDYIGQITGTNLKTNGQHASDRCPVLVSILNKPLLGVTCCYAVSQLDVISKDEIKQILGYPTSELSDVD